MNRPRTPAPSRETQCQIVAEYLSGKEMAVVARMFDTSAYHVAATLRRHDVQIRGVCESNRLRGAVVDEDRLRCLIDERLSLPEIATRLDVTPAVIEYRMKLLGLRSRHGRGSPLEKNHFWKGGRCIDGDGYVLIKTSGHPYATKSGYVREHRLVMERELGRYLEPAEIVHHQDGDKANNDPSNLRVYETNSHHFLDEHMDHPRDPVTGRFLSMQSGHQHLDRPQSSPIHSESETDALL